MIEFRLARENDLLEIKEMYFNLIDRMNNSGIQIWDSVYPCQFFEKDIINNSLYVLLKNDIIVGAFALYREHAGEKHVKWKNVSSKAFYIDRLGVNIDYSKQGIATELLKRAIEIVREKSGENLRLFVVESNAPAINVYRKFGFKQAEGIYIEVIDETLSFNELGFEISV